LKSPFTLIAFGVRMPRARSSSSKLLPAIAPFEKLAKTMPLKSLPPLRGMMFVRTPPSAASADTAVASMTTSCVALEFTIQSVSNASFAHPVERPFRFCR
jgi:hypothetical protein